MASESVRGAQVVIHFDGERCIHSRHCVLERPDVFVPGVQGEWIHPDRASVAEVARLARACPSGAIRYEPLDGSPGEAAPMVNTVRLRENGPLAFHAPLRIAGEDAGLRATLCRCGASKHKPYCDGSHVAAGFVASGEAATASSQALARRDGPLAIEPKPNGPLHVSGNLEVVTGTGRTIQRVAETWLCRCGQSKNKPYCDGTHRKVGFRSDV
ncbi:MAG: CDGSH iron-sulfur domain-containing protein [Rubrivivax sp.]|nr:CDGSH iron-sulfur domain-containing protein [Rubrivivax sp.]